MTDPQLRQEVATAVERHFRANPPREISVDDVEVALAAAITQTAESVIPSQERRRAGRGKSGDAQTEMNYRLRLMRCTQPGSASKSKVCAAAEGRQEGM